MTNFVVPVLSLLLKLYKPDKDRMLTFETQTIASAAFSLRSQFLWVPPESRRSEKVGFSKEYLNAFIMVFMQVPDTTTITTMSSPSCPPI